MGTFAMSRDGPKSTPPEDIPASSDSHSSLSVEREMLANLYIDFAPILAKSLRRAFGNGPPDPEDAAQQAFERVLERTDLAAIRDLKAFLWGTARNFMLSGSRSAATAFKYQRDVTAKFYSHQSYGIDPQRVINAREHVAQINAALERMPERRRRAFYLRRVEGLAIREVAQRLGISPAATSKHIAAASAELDILLTNDYEK
ncbi:MAG: sigma-70 family RNA polymerase sigma factor [Pseudomonadota bacterium]